ncbi:MAG TPA: hypothetical protein VGD07_24090 [Methylomirabilota bacterium]
MVVRHWGVACATVLVMAAGWVAAGPTVPGVTPSLLAKARQQGLVSVIVQVRVPQSAGEAEIIAAQDAVLAELGAAPHRVARRYTTIPFIALAVSEQALRVLAGSPHVASVAEDTVLRPSAPPTSPTR